MKSASQRIADFMAGWQKIPGDEKHQSIQTGVMIKAMAALLREVNIESPTGASSNALQEIAAILEGVGYNLMAGNATAKLYDREMVLQAMLITELAINGLAFLAKFNKDGANDVLLGAMDERTPSGLPVMGVDGCSGNAASDWTPPDLTPFI